LSEFLWNFSAWKATKVIDKIFVVLPLTHESEELQILIDYNTSSAEILLRIAEYFVNISQVFKILHFAGIGWGDCARDPELDELPSWVVD
jgi:hypothetical protein